jgi:hypothetical protein
MLQPFRFPVRTYEEASYHVRAQGTLYHTDSLEENTQLKGAFLIDTAPKVDTTIENHG